MRMISNRFSRRAPRRAELVLAAIVIGVFTSAAPALAQGRKPRGKTTAAQTLPALETKVAFPNLQFQRPVAFDDPHDGSNLFFVAEQHTAEIWSFPNTRSTKEKSLFLRLPDPIHRGNEEGLLGLAFHPKYQENKTFFVYYSADDQGGRRSVVSRFRVSGEKSAVADPASEERIWVSANDPWENHNGGTIVFGADGYLYITLGDGGAADDPMSSGQNPKDWFASILRIDVDHPSGGKAYGIPADNPALRLQGLRSLGPRGLLHRAAKRVEVQLRPSDRRVVGRRRGPERVGDGSSHRKWG